MALPLGFGTGNSADQEVETALFYKGNHGQNGSGRGTDEG